MKILFVGLGNLGSQVFDLFLLRGAQTYTFSVAGKNEHYLSERTSLTTYAAMQLGLSPDVEIASMDVLNVDRTAQTISLLKPDFIFCAVTLQPWMAIAKLPKPVFETLHRATPGPWLPLTLTPVYKLMQAVKQSGVTTKVINGSFPDTINAVLGKVGLAPLIGIGNLANTVPALRKSIALKLGASVEKVDLLLFGHHALSHKISHDGDAGQIPFHLTAYLSGKDLTGQLDMGTIFDLLPATLRREHTQLLTAASAAAVFEAIANNTGGIVHAPGPNGLVGAYPVRVKPERGIEIVLPKGLTLEEAIRINEDGQRFDGIERIDEDGTVHFTESHMAILEETFGYSCKQMALNEVEYWAEELKAKYSAFADRFL